MCGLILLLSGKSTTTVKQSEIFEQLLYANAVRGWHGTGVFTKDGWAKDSVLPRAFTEENRLYTTLSNKYIATPTGSGNFMVGHCRAATRGEINAKNCHPFVHNHIMMVHNGTLREQSLLPDYKDYEVDSDNIAFALSTLGTGETIKKLNGAFALIWTNTEENTLHLIKNSERTFYLQKTESGAYYGASEAAMLKWVLGRQNVVFKEDKGFELENGIEYVFDVDGTWKMEVERQLHKGTPYNSYYNTGRGGATIPEKKTQPVTTTGTTGGKTTPVGTTNKSNVTQFPAVVSETYNSQDLRVNANLVKAGLPDLKIRSEIEFVMTTVNPGKMHDMYEGYALKYFEDVRLYTGEPQQDWDFGKVYKGTILSAYFEKKGLNDTDGDLVILINSLSIQPVRDVSLQDELSYDAFTTGKLCEVLEEELLEEEEEEEEEDEEEDTSEYDDLLLSDLPWTSCFWCSDPISEDHRAECELYVRDNNISHGGVYCVNCIDSFEVSLTDVPF